MIRSLPGIVDIELVRGEAAAGPARFVFEVPHGADERHHYDALRERVRGVLPDRLHRWFHVNTDIGAYAYARAAAAILVRSAPEHSVVVARCLLPRTLIDVNRVLDIDPGTLGEGGVTPGLPPYIREATDKQLLIDLHRQYTEAVEQLYADVVGAGGLAVIPHTYAPRSVGISKVDEHIVGNLEHFYQPGVIETQPLRHEVDLLTTTPEGVDLSSTALTDGVESGLTALGYEVVRNGTYKLVPQSMGAVWSARYPGRTLCMEVRRDKVCAPWQPFEQQRIDLRATADIGGVLAEALLAAL